MFSAQGKHALDLGATRGVFTLGILDSTRLGRSILGEQSLGERVEVVPDTFALFSHCVLPYASLRN